MVKANAARGSCQAFLPLLFSSSSAPFPSFPFSSSFPFPYLPFPSSSPFREWRLEPSVPVQMKARCQKLNHISRTVNIRARSSLTKHLQLYEMLPEVSGKSTVSMWRPVSLQSLSKPMSFYLSVWNLSNVNQSALWGFICWYNMVNTQMSSRFLENWPIQKFGSNVSLSNFSNVCHSVCPDWLGQGGCCLWETSTFSFSSKHICVGRSVRLEQKHLREKVYLSLKIFAYSNGNYMKSARQQK